MKNQIKNYRKPVLRDRSGDLSKRWHICFYVFNPNTSKLERRILRVPSSLGTASERRAWAQTRMDALSKLLEDGYTLPLKAEEPQEPEAAKALMLAAMDSGLRPDSVRTYKNIASSFISFLQENGWGNLPPSELKGHHVASYLDKMASLGRSNATINGHLRVLKALGSRMAERGYSNELGKGVRRRKQSESRNTPFTDLERQALIEWFKANMPNMHLVVMLIYHAFIRPAEITRLKVCDIDMANARIKLSGAQTKNHRNANLPITRALLETLHDYGIERLDGALFLVGAGIKPGPNRCSRTRLSEAHRVAVKSCGINSGLTLYTWKDTGACNAYRAGIGIKTLQGMLRHSSVSQTETYLRGLGETLQEDIKGIEW